MSDSFRWTDLPSAEFSQCPFWFWNDHLEESEIRRQIAGFQEHGVEAFVIHPRIGLPRSSGWFSPELLRQMNAAIEEAEARGMWVILYDEGMYPSGSASGRVVARNPDFQTRGLCCLDRELSSAELASQSAVLAAVSRRHGKDLWIYHRRIDSVVRGLHYVGDETLPDVGEESPPAADLLNPEAMRAFIELAYEPLHAEFGRHFGKTVKAIFTDEPHPLGRCQETGIVPGSPETLVIATRMLGRDFAAHLPALWFDDEPDAELYRRIHAEAVAERLDETYYQPLSAWCIEHGIPLTGHPAEPTDIGHLRHFQIPGQDIVWRHVEPGKPSALEGPPSTMAKAAASSAFHHGRRRNLNEFAGAYGHSLTFTELQWLASWLLIRGCDLLVPHAFYYSVRGIRRDERPPDVGPNSPWWAEYRPWADFTRRLCALNALYRPVCEVAIMGRATDLPWRAAKVCFENQIDFHYVEPRDVHGARMEDGALAVGPGRYSLLIVEDGYDQPGSLPVFPWSEQSAEEFLRMASPVVRVDSPAPDLRARRLRSGTEEFILLFNEGGELLTREITLPWHGAISKVDLATGRAEACSALDRLELSPGGWAVYQAVSAAAPREKEEISLAAPAALMS